MRSTTAQDWFSTASVRLFQCEVNAACLPSSSALIATCRHAQTHGTTVAIHAYTDASPHTHTGGRLPLSSS